MGEVRIFKRCAAALKVLHPERQRKTFIVRAPRVFAVFWKIVRVFLDERIISKISILGVNDDLTPLVDEVGADYLPSLFGGGYARTVLGVYCGFSTGRVRERFPHITAAAGWLA